MHMCTYIPWNPMNTSPPSFVYASFGQNRGGGGRSLHFYVTTITDHRMLHGCAISALSLAVWWAKFEKVRHNNIMTQMASLVAQSVKYFWRQFLPIETGSLPTCTTLHFQQLPFYALEGQMWCFDLKTTPFLLESRRSSGMISFLPYYCT